MQVCYYFQMKFHNLNVEAKSLLHSKQNNKIKARNVYKLIKQHNEMRLLLNRFNDFWKYLLVSLISFYAFIIWFLLYVHIVYPNLDFLPKLFMYMYLFGIINLFAAVVLIIFNLSIQVIIT